MWGRDVGRLSLDTSAGPSWKPLPVLVTTPLAVTGDPAPALWLLVARTGALLALAGAFVLAARIGGAWAGAAAAGVMAAGPWWMYNAALGNSEGLLVAAILWAVVAHLEGHRRTALALATAAALLRPEVWPFLGAYGLWLWRTEPVARAAVVLAAVATPILWLGPDVLGIGGAVRASKSARGDPSPGSAGLEDVPALAVLGDAVELLTIPATLGALAAVILAWRAGRVIALLATGAAAWIAIVAVMAQAGYPGTPRYLVAATAAGSVLAGVGASRLGAAGALAVVAATGLVSLPDLTDQVPELRTRAERRAALTTLIQRAGGRDAILGCARVRTAAAMRPLVAWQLDLPMLDLDVPPLKPAVVLRWKPHFPGPVEPVMRPARRGFHELARAPGWEAWAACGQAPQSTS